MEEIMVDGIGPKASNIRLFICVHPVHLTQGNGLKV
jgi:hypothetical protein